MRHNSRHDYFSKYDSTHLSSKCHNASASNPKLDTYDGVKLVAADGRLLDAINHTGAASPMPKNGGKLPQCSLKQIEMWVTDGFPNN